MRDRNAWPVLAIAILAGCRPPAPQPAPREPEAADVAHLSGTVWVPAEVAGPARGVASLAQGPEVPGVAALMLLVTPDGKLVSFGGQEPVATTVDASGSYTFPQPLPVGEPFLVTAVLPGYRRLAGFAITVAGENTVEVSLASTYVGYLLAHKVREASASQAPYSPAQVAEAIRLTRQMMKAGQLPLPDLTLGADDEVAQTYVAGLPAGPAALRDLWTTLLGRRLEVARTVASGFGVEGPDAVAVGPEGERIWSSRSHVLRQAGPGGPLQAVAGVSEAGEGDQPLPADGVPFASARIADIYGIAVDSVGNIVLAMSELRVIACLCRRTGTYWGVPMREGGFFRLAGQEGRIDCADSGPGDGGSARECGFCMPWEVALDAADNLYVLDRGNDRIRRIRRDSGAITSVAAPVLSPAAGGASIYHQSATGMALRETGPEPEFYFLDHVFDQVGRAPFGNYAPAVAVAGSGEEGFAGDGGAALEARLALPRRAPLGGATLDRARGRYYFYDAGNQRIRALDLASESIRTVVGGGTRTADGEASSLRLSDVNGMAVTPDGDLLYADPTRQVGVQVNLGDAR